MVIYCRRSVFFCLRIVPFLVSRCCRILTTMGNCCPCGWSKVQELRVSIYEGDLLTEQVDAIVCATTADINHTSGLAKAIAEKAGRTVHEECRIINYLKPMEVMHTSSGNLKPNIDHVIHVFAPVDEQYAGSIQNADIVSEAYYNCLLYANDKLKVDSVAFPALCTGHFGIEKRIVAEAASKAVHRFKNDVICSRSITKIHFVNINKEANQHFQDVFRINKQYFPSHVQVEFHRPHYGSHTGCDVSVPRRQRRLKTNRSDNEHEDQQGLLSERDEDQGQWQGHGHHGERVEHSVSSDEDQGQWQGHGLSGQRDEDQGHWQGHHGERVEHLVSSDEDQGHWQGHGERVEQDQGQQPNDVRIAILVDIHDSSTNSLVTTVTPVTAVTPVTPVMATSSSFFQDTVVEDCVICMCPMSNPLQLPCGHSFCKDCIEQSFDKCSPKCPSCGRLYGIQCGNQPPGTMTHYIDNGMQLAGYYGYGTIVVTYDIPDGIQNDDHPNPGQPYTGTHRTAYLPDCPDGQQVLGLLRQAFDARLVFTIGQSVTTGVDNVVIWNDIHHKTSDRGPYGYPDDTYLMRIKTELAAKGIVPM